MSGHGFHVHGPHDHGLPQRHFFEMRQVFGQVPGHLPLTTDHAIAGARKDQAQFSHVQTATGALMPGWHR